MLAPIIFEENFIDDLFGFPMNEFDDMERNMERKLYGRKANRMMKTDIREKDDNYEVSVDLPGFKKEEITVELDNGYLTISAAKGFDKDENKKGFDCTISIQRDKNVITMRTENLGIAIHSVTTILDDVQDVYVALTGDQCAITNIRLSRGE